MRRNPELFRKALFGGGVAAMVIGLATVVYAVFFLDSRVSPLVREMSQNLTVARSGVSLLERNAGLLEASLAVLDQTKVTMRQSATALRSTAVTLRQFESPAGLVIPAESIEENASGLQNTASELDLLATSIDDVQERGTTLDVASVHAVLTDLRTQIGETERVLSGTPLALGAIALTILLGGMYILLGALAVALSGLMRTIEG